MSNRRGGCGRSLIGGLLVVLALPGATHARPANTDLFQSPVVYQEARAFFERCTTTADAACATNALSLFTSRLAPEVQALSSGRAGLSAWLRFAARLQWGRIPIGPRAQPLPLRDAIAHLYARIGYEPDEVVQARIDAQLARLSTAAAHEIAGFVSAFDLSLRLAEEASGDSALARWARDPRRAHVLAMQGMRAPHGPSAEAQQLLEAIARVDLEGMMRASLTITDALARFDESVLNETIDLPYIFIGGEGDTVHTQDRILSVDVSGDDTYLNNAGGGLVGTPFFPLGGAIAADLGHGNDAYDHEIGAQGYALGAVGILYDEGGSDRYHLGDSVGQGRGEAGIGVLYDAGGEDDRYLAIWEEGELTPVGTQGSGVAGIGMLIDEGGSDVFRQDGLDGIAHAGLGGLAILASLGPGDDTFRSDGASGGGVIIGPSTDELVVGVVQANAEVRGVAILLDERGDDQYVCNDLIRQGCQGTSDESSLAMLWDRSGDDLYFAEASANCDIIHDPDCLPGLPQPNPLPLEVPLPGVVGQGASYAGIPPISGMGMGVLRDEAGDDRYVAPKWAQGYGVLGSLGLLYDTGGGTDEYVTRAPLIGSRADGQHWIDGLLGIGIDE